ncbi:hypothetical protein LTR62_005422 [Meristemomyces frigidus]|uniref:Uncharacterized protein n=1 Tax=Meristemomyces frigidus TaxID=1508187 RepID=A0AAN7TFH9_9PEZI|nr:hypothetical protein LTR62_005422 [Meristemomyces frigidus]
MPGGLLWVALPGFEPMMEQALGVAFQKQFIDSKADDSKPDDSKTFGPRDTNDQHWTNLNNVLVRVSAAGIYDLRMCTLWALRDVLEDDVAITAAMLEVLIIWTRVYGFWIERLVAIEQLEPIEVASMHIHEPEPDIPTLHPGDRLTKEQAWADSDKRRCTDWKQRLMGVGRESEELKKAQANELISILPAGAK